MSSNTNELPEENNKRQKKIYKEDIPELLPSDEDTFVFICRCKSTEFRLMKEGKVQCLDCNRKYAYVFGYNAWMLIAPDNIRKLEKRRSKYNK
jgi:hypothetical protein